MLTGKPTIDEQTPKATPCVNNPVTVTMRDTIGAVFLGVLAVILLIGWRRAETRCQRLMTQQELVDKKSVP